MKYLIELLVVVSCTVSLHARSPDWHVIQFRAGPLLLAKNRSTFFELYISDRTKPGVFGPISIWNPKGTEEYVLISHSLSSLDEAYRAEGRDNPAGAMSLLTEYINMYRGTGGIRVLLGPAWNLFMMRLKEQVASDVYERLTPWILPSKISVNENKWEVSYTVITWRGAIERRSYHGVMKPASINKEEIEIIAPAGSVPMIRFNVDELNMGK